MSTKKAAANGKRTIRRRGDGRDRILTAALDQFARYGFDGTSTAEIAKEAGISQSVVLYHFATKDVLWQETMRRLFKDVNLGTVFHTGVFADLSALDRLRILLRQFVATSASHPQLGKIIFREGLSGGERLNWLISELAMPSYSAYFAIFRELAEAGQIPDFDPVLVTLAVHGAAATLFNLNYLSEALLGHSVDGQAIAEQQAELLVRLVTQGLLTKQT